MHNSHVNSSLETLLDYAHSPSMNQMPSSQDAPASEALTQSAATRRTLLLAFIPIGIVINLGVGVVVQMLKLPIYLDAIGTILMTLLIGFRAGAAVGVLSFLIGGVLVSPVLPYFCGTQLIIAAYVAFVARLGGYKTTLRTIASGIGLGIVAGIASAPVIVLVFGGVDGTSGASVVTSFLIASGKQVFQAVVISGLASEPLDKTLQCLIALWLARGLPRRILAKLPSGYRKENDLDK